MILRRLLACAALALLAMAPQAALAHGAGIFAYAEGETIHAEGYYAGGTRCVGCLVEVFDRKGNKLHEGKTDAQGKFSFEAPGSASLKLVLDAGGGHKATYLLEEYLHKDAPGGSAPAAPQERYADPTLEEAVEHALEHALQEKLQPVMDMLVELNRKASSPGAAEIIGGIGWVVGILGIIAYMKGRGRAK